jgi:hypothetical protein
VPSLGKDKWQYQLYKRRSAMNKILIISFCSFCLCIILCTPILQASSLQVPQEILMDDSQDLVDNPVYTPVVMPHQGHIALGCQSCHHTWEDTSQAPKKCTSCGCHDLIGASGEQIQEVNAAFNAYHNRESTRSCLGCHLDKNEAEQAFGPFANCADCHAAHE